ncbi:MAG: hypothetical protein KGJ84_11425 [Elusimicrobia bacterium]|nr:hypothetical protein [Elusimicrobiota bacterium]
MKRATGMLAAFLPLLALGAHAGEVVVVAPDSPMAPYREALQGVCDALGECPPVWKTADAPEMPDDVRVVIALGGRAARLRYRAGTAVVTALSPGREPRRDVAAAVRLTYAPSEFARRLRNLVPTGRRAFLLWSEPASGRFAAEVRREAALLSWNAVPIRVRDPEDIPALLRSLAAADALWMAPDPDLVTPTTFDAVREAAASRGAVFFAPAPGLAERGATPGLAPSFRASGLRAGEIARALLARKPAPEVAYPDDAPLDGRALLVSTRTAPSER